MDINDLQRTDQTVKNEIMKMLAMNILVALYNEIPLVNT